MNKPRPSDQALTPQIINPEPREPVRDLIHRITIQRPGSHPSKRYLYSNLNRTMVDRRPMRYRTQDQIRSLPRKSTAEHLSSTHAGLVCQERSQPSAMDPAVATSSSTSHALQPPFPNQQGGDEAELHPGSSPDFLRPAHWRQNPNANSAKH
jgi:hypothetical protein